MTYKLAFKQQAKKEWDNLDSTVRQQFIKHLRKRLQAPLIESACLSGLKDCYKIKLRQVGYRLVYQVRNNELIVVVIAVGKRERNRVYKKASQRLDKS